MMIKKRMTPQDAIKLGAIMWLSGQLPLQMILKNLLIRFMRVSHELKQLQNLQI